MIRIINKTLVVLVVSVLIVRGVGLAQATDTIKIALPGPVTGSVAEYGDMQFSGARMAIDQINKQGGVNGKQLEAIVYDDACNPKQAIAVANRIASDGILFVVGHLCSLSTQPASDIYEDAGILMITPASTSPTITARGHQLIFRTIGLDALQGSVAGRFIAEQIKPDRMAVIHDGQPYGEGIATLVKKKAEAAGISVALFADVAQGDKDFSALIATLKREDIDFVYFGGYHPELGVLLRQGAEEALKVQFMGPESVGNEDISAIAGQASEGLLVTLPKNFDKDPANAALVAAFEAKGKDTSNAFVFTAYSAVQVIAESMMATRSEAPEKVADHLRSNTFKTPIGELSFDKKGDLQDFSFVVYSWHADGTRKVINYLHD